jgi:hypothetical protein
MTRSRYHTGIRTKEIARDRCQEGIVGSFSTNASAFTKFDGAGVWLYYSDLSNNPERRWDERDRKQ